jgi:Protein of unknown function (DUF4065)
MTKPFNCEKPKLVAGLLYFSRKLIDLGVSPDIYRIFNIMYFADKKSLKTYYQTVFGGFHAGLCGPFQNELYQMYKEKTSCTEFTVYSDYYIEPLVEYDPDEFSETDLICMDESIKENGRLPLIDLYTKSHDSAWAHTLNGHPIDILNIAQSSGLNDHKIEYLKEVAQDSTLV